jgi:hypothetical protein
MAGCSASPQVPDSRKQNYPALIQDSTERRERADREWRRMLDAYGAPYTSPELDPVTYTPRSLAAVSGGLQIMSAPPDPAMEELGLREGVKKFIDRWRELIGADPATISLVEASPIEGGQRLTYRQAGFSYPVADNFGVMIAVITSTGRLLQLDDRFLPVVELPARPTIEREAAAAGLVGRTFTYSDIAGRPQQARINNEAEVTVRQLVVLPVEKENAIEAHLAWEIIAGSSLSWTVFIDAINGEELKVVQNFQT